MQTLNLFAKSSDRNVITLPDGTEHEGYIPDGLGIGGGDYVELSIDIETGKVVGWSDKHRQAVIDLQNTPL